MKIKTRGFQNLLAASDVINLKIISVINGTLNTKIVEITNEELIMSIFYVVTSNKQWINQGAT